MQKKKARITLSCKNFFGVNDDGYTDAKAKAVIYAVQASGGVTVVAESEFHGKITTGYRRTLDVELPPNTRVIAVEFSEEAPEYSEIKIESIDYI